jgi:protein deglycase
MLAPAPAALRPVAGAARPARALSASSAAPARPRVLVPIATGSEEMETACIVDVLRRAGCEVTLASCEDISTVSMSRGMLFSADTLLSSLRPDSEWECIALPGGMPGAAALAACTPLTAFLRAHAAQGRLVAAMCAAPVVVLQPLGLLDGVHATAHPAFSDKLPLQDSVEGRVVLDGNVVTSRGPGTAIEFSLALAQLLCGSEMAASVAGPLLLQPRSSQKPAVPHEWAGL